MPLTLQSKKKSICFDIIMDKEALLKIILSDINEVETLLKSFQGKTEIPPAFINLTERKLSHISEEFILLKSLTEISNVLDKPVASKPIISEPLIQPSIEEKPQIVVPVEQTNYVQSGISESKEEVIETIPNSTEPTNPILQNEEPIIAQQIQTPIKETPVQKLEETHQPIIDQVNLANSKHENVGDKSKTLGEALINEKKSVNDLMANTKESGLKKTLMGKPVNDLTKELGINDRFMFQRELFNSNSDLMTQTLKQLNELPDFNSAHTFLSTNFSWDEELESTQSFYNYIKRKFLV